MKKKILGLISLLGASAVASMCVIPHVNYNENLTGTYISNNKIENKYSSLYSTSQTTIEFEHSEDFVNFEELEKIPAGTILYSTPEAFELDGRIFPGTYIRDISKYVTFTYNEQALNDLSSEAKDVWERADTCYLIEKDIYCSDPFSAFTTKGYGKYSVVDLAYPGNSIPSSDYDILGDNTSDVKLVPGSIYMANRQDVGDFKNVSIINDETKLILAGYNEVSSYSVFTPTTIQTISEMCSSLGGSLVGDVIAIKEFVKDIQAPSIDGTNNFVVNVNNMLSKEEILSHITAVDDTDGLVDVVIDSSTYDPANRKVGDYTMNVSASDKAGNKTTAVITIKVVDIDKPTISGTSSYTVEYDAPVSLDTIKGALTVSDNYDTGLELQVIQDNYTGHEREVGAHTITFKAVDSSKNESDVYTVTVNVQDTKKPVISAPGKITVPTNTLLTLEELKAKINITDGLDGPITEYEIVGYENYQANYKTVGNYTITINVKDANNNPATATIIITTEDKIAPEIWFDDYFIILGLGEQLTDEQIREYASKVLGISVESIAEVSGEWNTSELGTYQVSVKTVSGEAYSFRLFVDEQPYQEVVELDWWDRIWKGLSVALGIEDGYRADGFIDWFTDIPERFSLCWDIWTTGSYIKRTGSLPESSKTQQELYQENVISEVAFKNTIQIENYIIEF